MQEQNGVNRNLCGVAPPGNKEQPEREDRYTGFIIIRLSEEALPDGDEDLTQKGTLKKLPGLRRVLDEYDIENVRRVVRSQDPKQILELEHEAQQSEFPPMRSLTSYWRLDVRHLPEQSEALVKTLNGLYGIDHAYRQHEASDPSPVNAADDTYSSGQTYLDAAPDGIDARWVWTQPAGEGAGVGVIDLEQGWFPNHEDLSGKSPSLIYGDNRDGVGTYKGNHGTAVLGEVAAEDNAVGVVGIAPGVSSVQMTSHYDAATNTSGNVADAIIAAIPVMDPGDVLLLEVQKSFKPTEIDDADFDAIRLAVAHGIIVVEAAGNGNTDLDAYTNSLGDQILDRTSPDFRESGAIMCGAADSSLPHNRSSFSNYGSRIDCYGWGEDIVTCGYGDLDAGTGDNSTYTGQFGGTSGASPMITGAALLLQGMYENTTGTRLSPGQMRALLSDPATGTPQGGGVAGNIGVMPNLRAIVENTLDLVPDVYVRDQTADTGDVPTTGLVSASPDVIVRPSMVADPNASFGEGSGTENSAMLGYEVEAGQDNYIYVRLQNRGATDAAGVTATVYWSEVSTLVTPDTWTVIGTTSPINAPQGDTLVVSDALTWSAADIPGEGHYCFVAILDHDQDEAPPVPGPTDWNGFKSFIKNQNNVAWRNFNVVDEMPDPNGDPALLPFVIAGAPDRARRFDLEVIQRLPREARLRLEVPLALAKPVLRNRRWDVDFDRDAQVARIRLPNQKRTPMCDLRLGARARHEARFIVEGAEGMEHGGHMVAMRQLHDNEEVGRVTWQFHNRVENINEYGRVFFDFDEVDIKPEYEEVLARVAELMKRNPEPAFQVVGHSDIKGDEEVRQEIAQKRADHVRYYLVENHEIDSDRLDARGVGAMCPIAPNDTDAGRAQNRRVEFVRQEM